MVTVAPDVGMGAVLVPATLVEADVQEDGLGLMRPDVCLKKELVPETILVKVIELMENRMSICFLSQLGHFVRKKRIDQES